MKPMYKAFGNRAIELLQLLQQVLEAGGSPDTSSPTEKKLSEPSQQDDIGKTQPVGDYPDSPLRYRGAGR